MSDRMFHFTCDHGADGIKLMGKIFPNPHLLLDISLAWFTNLPDPDRDAVGLTSTTLTCDRTQYRFEVDPADVMPWMKSVLRAKSPSVVADLERFGTPEHWFISLIPVAVKGRSDG